MKLDEMRSLLIVDADDAHTLSSALTFGAEALFLDLFGAANKPRARKRARGFLLDAKTEGRRPKMLVRVSSLEDGEIEADLDAIVGAAPDAVVLPKSTCGADVQRLSVKLAVKEAEAGLADRSVGVIASVTETAAAVFGLTTYARSSSRLSGLIWSVDNLAADLGAGVAPTTGGDLIDPFRLARSLVLYAAANAGVGAFDGAFADNRDVISLRSDCETARQAGFTGKLAVHPSQIATINSVFATKS